MKPLSEIQRAAKSNTEALEIFLEAVLPQYDGNAQCPYDVIAGDDQPPSVSAHR